MSYGYIYGLRNKVNRIVVSVAEIKRINTRDI
jgi:hypothetical protein